MPGPITHILCASLFLCSYSHHWNEKEFIRGTAIPDIRYLGVIEREKTHHKNVSIQQIQQTASSFQAGILFHSYIDDAYNHFMESHKVCPKDSSSTYESTLFKCYVDYALYERSTTWNSIGTTLQEPSLSSDEMNFPVAPKNMHIWYNLIADFCSQKPSGKTIASLFSISNRTNNSGNAMSTIIANGSITYIADNAIARYTNDQTLNKYPNEFYRFIETKLHKETTQKQGLFISIKDFFSSLFMRIKSVLST